MMSGWLCCTTPCHPMCVWCVCMATRWCGGCAHWPIHTNTVVWAWRSMVRVVSVEVVVAHVRHVVHAQRPRADTPHKQPRGHAGLAPPLSAHRVCAWCVWPARATPCPRLGTLAHIAHPHAKPLHHPPCHTHACRVQPWCQTHTTTHKQHQHTWSHGTTSAWWWCGGKVPSTATTTTVPSIKHTSATTPSWQCVLVVALSPRGWCFVVC